MNSVIKVMSLRISSNDGVPKVDASVGTFVEQLVSRGKVTIEGIVSDDFGGKKGVKRKMGLSD